MSAEATMLPGVDRTAASLRPLLLLIGIAAAVAAGVAVTLWSREPSYSVLFAGLSTEETAGIVQALESSGIPHRMEAGTGAVAVPSERLADARLKLASQGLPQGEASFASLSKEPGFGVSQFMESARYQHALEGELARTIASLKGVQGARVQIARPRDTAFVRDRHAASASVFLQLKSGHRLDSEQVTAIVNLVASSVPELTADQVTVIDNTGRLLSAPDSKGEFATRDKEFEYANRLEEAFKDRIESLLAPLVGPGRVRAQVVAQVDMSSSEEAREQYNPERQVVRSEQTSEETSRNGAGGAAAGVPGSLTNQPPSGGVAQPVAGSAAPAATAAGGAKAAAAAATAAAAAQAEAASRPPDNVTKQATRNYEIDRTLAYTRQPAGRLKRLTVAVLIDNVRTTDAKGAVKETPLPAAQLERVTALVKDAVGFDQARGDSVNVVNASFTGDVVEVPKEFESPAIWDRPMVRDIVKLVVGLIALVLLVLMVLRPLVKNLVTPMRDAVFSPGSSADGGAPRPQLAAAAGGAEPTPALAYEQQLAAARTLVTQDPKRVAQVVKSMVGKDG